MRVSDEGVELIAGFEGFRGTLYNDPAGNCTIGYGFLVHRGPCDGQQRSEAPYGLGMTEPEARRLLREKAQYYGDAVLSVTPAPLTQSQFDALTSFCYNIGRAGYRDSSVRRAVENGGDVCAELRKYIRGTDGVVYPGLVRRRDAECRLYMRGGEDMSGEQYDELKGLIDKQARDLRDVLRFSAAAFRRLASDDGDLKAALAAAAAELDGRLDELEGAAGG